jgi:hypothetical protein
MPVIFYLSDSDRKTETAICGTAVGSENNPDAGGKIAAGTGHDNARTGLQQCMLLIASQIFVLTITFCTFTPQV